MTSEHQKAVCGTCGDVEDEPCLCAEKGSHDEHICEWAAAGYHPFIPAPVVPSDDECDHAWSAVGVSLERIQCLECREFAPPTPSQDAEDAADADMAAGRTHSVSSAQELVEWLHAPQDAEGDGLAYTKPWSFEVCQSCGRKNIAAFRVTDSMWRRVTGQEEGIFCIWCFDEMATANGIDWTEEPVEWHPVSTVANAKWAEVEMSEQTRPPFVESAIREPYEALVQAARDARSALVLLTSELSGQMGYIEGLQQRPHGQPQRTINYAHDVHAFLTATLTRIEESLGGRKDG